MLRTDSVGSYGQNLNILATPQIDHQIKIKCSHDSATDQSCLLPFNSIPNTPLAIFHIILYFSLG